MEGEKQEQKREKGRKCENRRNIGMEEDEEEDTGESGIKAHLKQKEEEEKKNE